mmetsp:Transcript_73259/g.136911  ORF Transcript_73259/g.136911 Transcript_73259/m.136911 type:complete len:396 (-) Transcript_73259:37-1224(-)
MVKIEIQPPALKGIWALAAPLIARVAVADVCSASEDGLWLLQRGARIEVSRELQGDTSALPKASISLTQLDDAQSSHIVDVPNVTVSFYTDSQCQAHAGTNASLPLDKDLCSLDWNFTCGCQKGKKVVYASTYFPSCEDREESHTEVVQIDSCEDSSKFGNAPGLYGKIVDNGACPCCSDDKQCVAYGEPRILGFDKAEVALFQKRGNWPQWRKRRKEVGGDVYLMKTPHLAIQARYGHLDRSGNQLVLRALAVGGQALDGNRMIIEPLDGTIRWGHRNGRTKEVLSHDAPVLKILGLVSARVSNRTRDIEHPEELSEGLQLHLPSGFQLVVNRRATSLVAAIVVDDSTSLTDIDGQCGHLNGDPDDDTPSWIQARLGKRIPRRSLLFDHPRAAH